MLNTWHTISTQYILIILAYGSGAIAFGFVVGFLFCFVFPYQITFVSSRGGWDIYDWAPDSRKRMTLGIVIKSELCSRCGFRSTVWYPPTPRLCPVRAKQSRNLRSPHKLSRPASWIKLQKEPLFKSNFDIRLAQKIQCSGLSDTILISLVILAKKDMKVWFFHRRSLSRIEDCAVQGRLAI